MDQKEWSRLSYTEKNRQLYYRQKKLLDTFLEHHTISKEQYDKSIGDLTLEMADDFVPRMSDERVQYLFRPSLGKKVYVHALEGRNEKQHFRDSR